MESTSNSNIELEQPNFETIDVLIVGGGLSGLTSAYKIKEKEKSLNVIILEANSVLGGQLVSTEYGELGARYITKHHYHIYELLTKFGVELKIISPNQCYILNDITENEYLIKSKLIEFEIKTIMSLIDLKSESFKPGEFKICKEDPTVENFLMNNLLFERSRKIMRFFVRLICGTCSINIKLSEFLSICYSNESFQKFINLYFKTGLSSDYIIEFSSKKLLEKFNEHLEGVQILTNTIITDVFHYPDYVLVRDSSGNVFHTSILILAIPWNKVQRLNIYPSIPKELIVPVSNVTYLMTSFIAYYPKYQPWKKTDFCGTLINLEQPTLIAYEYEKTKFAGFVLHNHFHFDSIAETVILTKLSEKFGIEMLSPEKFVQKTFQQNLLLNLPPTTPWNRVLFSSTTSATSYRGCLSGAVQSGYRAAINALLTIRPQNVSWKDIDQMQKASPIRLKRMHLWKSFTSSVNIIHYSTISLGIILLIISGLVKRYLK